MGSYSDYLENVALNNIWGSGNPATVFVALFTVMPDEAGAGGTEVTGGSYTRVAITNNTTNFPNSVASLISLAVEFDFPQSTADWGTVVGAGLYDAASGGNLLGYDDFTPFPVPSGSMVHIGVGGIMVTQD